MRPQTKPRLAADFYHWTPLLAGILACGSFVVTGCKPSIAEVRVVLKIELAVTSLDGEPMADLEILLQDHGMPKKLWTPRRFLLCKTNNEGLCHKVVTYGYGKSSWPWERRRKRPELLKQFEIFAKHNGNLVSLGFLPIENSRQAQGDSKIVYKAFLR